MASRPRHADVRAEMLAADAIAAARPGWWVRATATIAGLPSGGAGR